MRQIEVNYARSAKVVDVRVLKQTLWAGLRAAAAEAKGVRTAPAQPQLNESWRGGLLRPHIHSKSAA